MFKPSEIIGKFVHYFKRQGNIFKLITVLSAELETLKKTVDKTLEWRAIENAEGTTLDEIGYNLNQPRGNTTDEVYRVLLRSKIARNMADGTVNKMLEILTLALDVQANEIKIVEQWNDLTDAKNATLKLTKIPYTALAKSGIDANNFYRFVKSTVACGVALAPIELEGTFEMGSINTPPSREFGFSSIADPESGGYFGAVYTSSDDNQLPL